MKSSKLFSILRFGKISEINYFYFLNAEFSRRMLNLRNVVILHSRIELRHDVCITCIWYDVCVLM